MGGEREREHRRIHNPDVRKPIDLEVRVDHAARVERQHRARRRRMVLSPDRRRKPRVPVVVALHARAGRRLLPDRAAQRGGLADLARELQALAEDDDVGGVREVLRVDRGRGEGVARGDVEPALREGVLERGLDGDGARAGEGEEDLDLADRAREEGVDGGVVDELVALLDCGVGAGAEVGEGGRVVGSNFLLELGREVAEEVGDVHVCGSGVDEGHEGGGVAVRIFGVKSTRSVDVGLEGDFGALQHNDYQ